MLLRVPPPRRRVVGKRVADGACQLALAIAEGELVFVDVTDDGRGIAHTRAEVRTPSRVSA
jgi:chemotaxis protein histidine kinase CheA